MSLRSPGPHFAAQPPFEVSWVKRMKCGIPSPPLYLYLLPVLSLRGSISALMLDPPCVQRVFLERYASGLSRNYLP